MDRSARSSINRLSPNRMRELLTSVNIAYDNSQALCPPLSSSPLGPLAVTERRNQQRTVRSVQEPTNLRQVRRYAARQWPATRGCTECVALFTVLAPAGRWARLRAAQVACWA
jgi:hypothetical protein